MDDDQLRQMMATLALSFPSMSQAIGANPWDAEALNLWSTGSVSGGQRVTARFLLSVWDPYTEWEAGPFDLREALRFSWDLSHRQAFLTWAAEPWWP